MADSEARLAQEIATVHHELARIDGKAATLAALAGAGIAFLITQLGPGIPIVTRVLLGLAVTALTAAVLILLRLLRPVQGGQGGFWAHAGHPSVDALKRWAEEADRENALAEELLALSRITATRQRHLRRAVDTLAAAVAFLLAAGLTQLI